MENLKEIIQYLNNYLKVEEFDDGSWNGLQVEGRQEVKKIAFCVSAGGEVFEEVLQESPDLIVVHHGIFWKDSDPSIKNWMKKRIKPLIETDTSLYACHLPLDSHKEVGNNAQILKKLGSTQTEEMANYKGKNVGWIGEVDDNDIFQILEKMEEVLDSECKLLDFGPEKIKRIGAVSGSGGRYIYEAIDKNLDLLITGEESDITEVAKDASINVIFGGHYATETLGIIALKKKIQEKFSTNNLFLDFPTTL